MISIVKVISSKIKDKISSIKSVRFGDKDVVDDFQVSPFGLDSRPIKNQKGLYIETGSIDQSVFVGFLNENALADEGEIRIFSMDSDGNEQTYLWVKNDGTIEIGGDQGNAVRYQELEQQFNELNDKFNDLVTAFNSHQHIGNMGAPTAPPPGFVPSQPSTADITQCKIDKIKTI